MIAATTIWRVRPSGSDVNGGGFDPAISGTLSTTLNGAISAGVTTVVVTSATGWPSSGNYYARIGAGVGVTGASEVVQVTGGQGTTSWTVTRGVLGTTAAAQASGIPVDNELSCCNTAIASGSVGTSTASTTFVDATAAFDLTCVGNVMWIASGTGATVGAYVVQNRTNATTIVLDRVSGTYTAGVWKLGGGWATINSSNLTSTGPLVAGNNVYILGTGIPTRGSTTCDYNTSTNYFQPKVGDTTNGYIGFLADPTTPNYATGGMPSINSNGLLFYRLNYNALVKLFLIASGASNGSSGIIYNESGNAIINDCTIDQNGYDVKCINIQNSGEISNTEIFSNQAKRTTNSNAAITTISYGTRISNCNIHECIGLQIDLGGGSTIRSSLIVKGRADGVSITNSQSFVMVLVNNTIDGNVGNGVIVVTQAALGSLLLSNNVISNHTGGGKYGLTISAGTTATNDKVKMGADFNVYYNNTGDVNAISYGVNDQHGGADPYVDQVNNDYTLTTTYKNTGFPQGNFPGY